MSIPPFIYIHNFFTAHVTDLGEKLIFIALTVDGAKFVVDFRLYLWYHIPSELNQTGCLSRLDRPAPAEYMLCAEAFASAFLLFFALPLAKFLPFW